MLKPSSSSKIPKTKFTQKDFKRLSKVRIIQKNLVHVQGLQKFLLDKELLLTKEYFGQYGNIKKIVTVNKEDERHKPLSYSAYITYASSIEAAFCVLAVDSIMIDGYIIRAFFGTCKYCTHFLNNLECYNKDKCMFIHHLAPPSDILGAESKFGYEDHIKCAKEIINFNSYETKNFIKNFTQSYPAALPEISTIYKKYNLNISDPNNIQSQMNSMLNETKPTSNENNSFNILNVSPLKESASTIAKTKFSEEIHFEDEEAEDNELFLYSTQNINNQPVYYDNINNSNSDSNEPIINNNFSVENVNTLLNYKKFPISIGNNFLNEGHKPINSMIRHTIFDNKYSAIMDNNINIIQNKPCKFMDGNIISYRSYNNNGSYLLFKYKSNSRFYNQEVNSIINTNVNIPSNLSEFIDDIFKRSLFIFLVNSPPENSKINLEILKKKYKIPSEIITKEDIISYLFEH